jgi:hypothetical protein
MLSTISKLFTVALSAIVVSAHPPKTGAIVASQLRCEGYLCPQVSQIHIIEEFVI